MTESDAKKWDDRWCSLASMESGGQGVARTVALKSGDDPTRRFLKELHSGHHKRPDRRNRFYREVAAYRTLRHIGIPTLVETNADHFGDLDYHLYVVTELVPGTPLSKWIETHGPLGLEDAVALADALLSIVVYCADSGVVHRDIKPDNIVLRDDDFRRPVLVDFGLSFNHEDPGEFATATSEEVQTRFLRLPEQRAHSPNKQDLRVDVTLCCGVFFYVLTGQMPVVLVDENNRMPHERADALLRMADLQKHPAWERLRRLFHVGFQNELALRHRSASDLRNLLLALNRPAPLVTGDNPEADELIALLESQATQRHMKIEESMLRASKKFVDVMTARGRPLLAGGSGPNMSSHRRSVGVNFFFVQKGRSEPTVRFDHIIVLEDDAVVAQVQVEGNQWDEYYRGSAADESSLIEAVEQRAILAARTALTAFSKKLKLLFGQ